MRVLLDTHAILYAMSDVSKLGRRALRLIESPDTVLFGSLASLWEIAIKLRIGKLELPVSASVFWNDALKRARIVPMAIDESAILKTLDFDLSHRDPFDRLLAAQAMVAGIPFISSDSAVDVWGVERIWD